MRTILIARVALLVLLSACATGTPAGAPSRPTTERVDVQDSGNLTLGNSTARDMHETTFAAPIANVWRVLPAVLDSLGVPVNVRDQASGSMGNAGYAVRRTMGGTMVTRYFDCGEARGGSSALSYDLFVTVSSHVRATAPDSTSLLTTTTVRAKPVSYSGSWIPCASVGLLEQRIADGVRARLPR